MLNLSLECSIVEKWPQSHELNLDFVTSKPLPGFSFNLIIPTQVQHLHSFHNYDHRAIHSSLAFVQRALFYSLMRITGDTLKGSCFGMPYKYTTQRLFPRPKCFKPPPNWFRYKLHPWRYTESVKGQLNLFVIKILLQGCSHPAYCIHYDTAIKAAGKL